MFAYSDENVPVDCRPSKVRDVMKPGVEKWSAPRCSLLSYRRCFTQPVQQSPTTAARRKRKLTQYPSHESVCRKVRRSREFTAPPRRRANSPSLKSHRSLLHGFGSDELYWRLHGLIRAGTAKLTHVEHHSSAIKNAAPTWAYSEGILRPLNSATLQTSAPKLKN